MTTFSQGKYALAISDRSGMAFPYNEMVLLFIFQNTNLNNHN